jgi:D-glycerate 3-kinase
MAQVLERTQRLRQHLESLLRRDLAARRGAQVAVDEAALRRRVDDYYLPMFLWTEEVVAATQRRGNGDADSRCVVLGLSCPQGGGKTTVCNYLEEMMTHEGKTCAVMSLDDVYWSRAKQLEVAATNPGNPLLQVRRFSCCIISYRCIGLRG